MTLSFQRTFHFFTYATALVAFGAMAYFVELHAVAIVIFLVALTAAGTRGWHGVRLSNSVWLVLSLLVLAGGIHAWFVLFERLYAVVYTFLYLEINKLWTADRNKDYLQVLGLTFFQVLASSVSTASVLFAPVLLVYLFLVLGALIAVTMKGDAELAFRGDSHGPGWRRGGEAEQRRLTNLAEAPFLGPGLVRTLVGCLLGIMVVGACLFYVIPRLQAQSFVSGVAGPGRAHQISGFSDSVEFVGMGEIQTDNTIAARAIPGRGYVYENDYPVPALLRLRGTALDHYDGRRWDKSVGVRNRVRMNSRSSQIMTMAPQTIEGQRVHTTIHLEPNSSGYLFAPGWAVEYNFEGGLNFTRDPVSDSLQLALDRWTSTLSYTVASVLPEPNSGWRPEVTGANPSASFKAAAQATSRNQPPEMNLTKRLLDRFLSPRLRNRAVNDLLSLRDVETFYLQTPDHPDMETVKTLAAQWIEAAAAEAPVEKAKALELRLQSDYSYSLDVSYSRYEKHLTHFLIGERAGHCEYFATAMVMMLRSQRIPARIVNGYATDEWVRGSGYYIVRNAHAHSWVEAYMPGSGWITFDPTPASGLGQNRLGSQFSMWATRWYDAVKFAWYDRVIDFDSRDQMRMYSFMFLSLHHFDAGDLLDSIGRSARAPGAGFRFLMAGVLAAAALALLVMVGREWAAARRRASRAEPEANRMAPSVVIEVYLALLAAAGRVMPRPPGQTPHEYAAALAAVAPELDDFPALTAEYYRARYNGHPWSGELEARARELLRRITTGAIPQPASQTTSTTQG